LEGEKYTFKEFVVLKTFLCLPKFPENLFNKKYLFKQIYAMPNYNKLKPKVMYKCSKKSNSKQAGFQLK